MLEINSYGGAAVLSDGLIKDITNGSSVLDIHAEYSIYIYDLMLRIQLVVQTVQSVYMYLVTPSLHTYILLHPRDAKSAKKLIKLWYICMATSSCLICMASEGRFTLWPSKSGGRAIEWPTFVESPKK
jgi:hypothetical protein